MGLNIDNAKLEADIRKLAEIEGLGLTETIQKAVTERLTLTRILNEGDIAHRMAEVRRIQAEVRKIRGSDTRTSKELLDELYDQDGFPA